MKCPKCKAEFVPTNAQIASELGSRTSTAKKSAAQENGKLGGRPRKTDVRAQAKKGAK